MPEGRLALVDLAGSERQSLTSVHDRRRIDEARAINRSLTTLAKVVRECGSHRAPGPQSQTSSETRQWHVPYRDSVLTRLLCDCIGGTARTLFIVHASPEECDIPETLCTLQFGISAKRVRTQQECEQCKGGRSQRRIDRLSEDNDRLRRELVKERRRRRRLCAALPDAEQTWSRLRSPRPRRAHSQGSTPSSDKEIKTAHGHTSSDLSPLDQYSLGSLSPTYGSESTMSSPSPETKRTRARTTSPSPPTELGNTKESKENRGRQARTEKNSCCGNTSDKNAKENKGCPGKKLPAKRNQRNDHAFRPALREVTAA